MSSSERRELEAVRLRAVAVEQRYRALQEELREARQRISTLEQRPSEEIIRLRGELEEAQTRVSTLELGPCGEIVRLEKELGEARAQIVTLELEPDAERLHQLQRELQEAKAGAATGAITVTAQLDARIRELTEQQTSDQERAAAAEKQLAEMRGRLERAEASMERAEAAFEQAVLKTAAAEATIEQLERRIADQRVLAKLGDEEYAAARAENAALKMKLEEAPLEAAQLRGTKLAAEVAELGAQLAAERARIVELEHRVSGARDVAEVDSAIAEAAQAKRVAAEHGATVRAAERRAEDAEARAAAADTVAKAMSRDVVEGLRRVGEADMRARRAIGELDEAKRRASEAEARSAEAEASIGEVQRRATEAEERAAQLERDFGVEIGEVRAKLGTKISAVERELAAERSSALALINRKNQLDRELAATRDLLAAANARIELAEKHQREQETTLRERVRELEGGAQQGDSEKLQAAEREIEGLRQRARDLESEIAVVHELEGELAARSLADGERTTNSGEDPASELLARVHELEAANAQAAERVQEAEREIANLRDGSPARLSRRSSRNVAVVETDRAAERQVEELKNRVRELEAAIAAAEVAAGRRVTAEQLSEANQHASAAERQVEELQSRIRVLETGSARRSRRPSGGGETAEVEELRSRVRELEGTGGRAATVTGDQVAESEQRAIIAERDAAGLRRRVHELEAEIAARPRDSAVDKSAADIERRAITAEQDAAGLRRRVHELEAKVAAGSADRLAESERRAAGAERDATALRTRVRELENELGGARRTAVDNRLTEAERRAGNAERDVVGFRNRVRELEGELAAHARDRGASDKLRRELAAAKERMVFLENEVASAENVRSFAAETEREIAQLRAQLREARSALTQMRVERDRLAELHDFRGDETTNERDPRRRDSIVETGQFDIRKRGFQLDDD